VSSEEEPKEKRDLELENIVGSLLVAEYKVDRLRGRLANVVVNGYRPTKTAKNKASINIFKHNNRWYKISLKIDETYPFSSIK
jgi:hypothetical protein